MINGHGTESCSTGSQITYRYFPTAVVFDNVFTQKYFEKKFRRKYYFIPYGSEVKEPSSDSPILDDLGITVGKYILFVGRFIPDKGVHLLIHAFESIKTDMKLVLVGGSPHPGRYDREIHQTKDDRILLPDMYTAMALIPYEECIRLCSTIPD